MKNDLVSIAIPTYEMKNRGYEFLSFSFGKILDQTYKNIQIVISDHSRDEKIKDLCKNWSNRLNIKYIKNDRNIGSSSSNINKAINNCDGTLIKILFQDDFLYDKNSISDIVKEFNIDNDIWLVTSCCHTIDGINLYYEHHPTWNDNIINGINTISSPSVLTIKNNIPERFDESLIWLMDCDMYKQLYDKYGLPKILKKVNVVNRLWGDRLSDNISIQIQQREKEYMIRKYKNK